MKKAGWITTVLVVLATLAPAQAAADSDVVTRSASQSPQSIRAYWTPERMAAALPVPAPVHLDLTNSVSSSSSALGPAERAIEIPDTTVPGIRTHGKLFTPSGTCSGTVVTSQRKRTVWTAAHCVDSQALFIPAYDEGAEPFGRWAVVSASVPQQWSGGTTFEDLSHDFAALKLETQELKPLRRDCSGLGRRASKRCRRFNRNREVGELGIQEYIGARGIAFGLPASDQTWSAYGYPVKPSPPFDGETMQGCTSGLFPGTSPDDPGVFAIQCDQEDGASGSGYVVNDKKLNGNASFTVPGQDNALYSPYFGSATEAFYEEAVGSG